MTLGVKSLVRNLAITVLLSTFVVEQAAFCEPPAWKQMSAAQKCRETLKILVFVGVFSGGIWALSEGPHLYYQHEHRVRLLKEFKDPYQKFESEYRKVASTDPRYAALVRILLDEVQKSDSFFDFYQRAQKRKLDIEAVGLKLEEVQKLPPSFQEAFVDLAMKTYTSGMSYDDLRWIIEKAINSN